MATHYLLDLYISVLALPAVSQGYLLDMQLALLETR
jgi:hypothetical protein